MNEELLPLFDDLPIREGAPPGSSWGVFGPDDQAGTLNFIGAEQILAAARLVHDGRAIPLNLSVTAPSPALFHRSAPVHNEIVLNKGESLDDYLDNFYPHASSHWDALRHYADVEFGFYNGAALADVVEDPSLLAVEHWARRGIVSRGVLLDAQRALALDPLDFFEIGEQEMREIARRQGVALQHGDIVLVRTGWLEAFSALGEVERAELVAAGPPAPGLGGASIPGALWDLRIAAAASDTPVFEAQRGGAELQLFLHKSLIARLGMPIGELWDLDGLALDCARDGRYEFLLTSAPLNVPGGAGSPANALAIK